MKKENKKKDEKIENGTEENELSMKR